MASEMWRPPVNRLMRTLDRSFFRKVVDIKAAQVLDNKNIARCKAALGKSKDALDLERHVNVVGDPNPELARLGRKCILLRPEFKASESHVIPQNDLKHFDGSSTPWPYSSTVADLVAENAIAIVPYQLELDYNHWTYHDIMVAILPEDAQGEIPSGFAQVGHIAHLNIRDEYLKYKHLIAEVIVDKNPGVRTVINKTDDVGGENEFRTFRYEVLTGPDDMNVTMSEEDCVFRFDYSKVYWNTRLNTEHRRLVSLFSEGEAVCDVMAGIGPFAVPAGKRKVFVWANDLNPDSFASLRDAITRNKVQTFVRPFNEDGKTFIRDAVARISRIDETIKVEGKRSKKQPALGEKSIRTLRHPTTFDHFVMNLPATALTFLPSFIGVYTPAVRAALGNNIKMPLIHAYCFNTKSDDNVEEGNKICEDISNYLGHRMFPGSIQDGKIEIHDVRDVAPKKRMFCASFRLPEEVAFRLVS